MRNDKTIIKVISLVYFPGTVLHELSHYIVALLLNLHPREIQLFPIIEGNKIKLGHVLYEKNPHDFLRSILVGIAPFMGGMISLWLIIQTKLFPGNSWWQTLIFSYLILAISANMFSSKQDLIDVGYLIPLGLFISLILYFVPIQIDYGIINRLISMISYFIIHIQTPLLFSLGIHAILVLIFMKFK